MLRARGQPIEHDRRLMQSMSASSFVGDRFNGIAPIGDAENATAALESIRMAHLPSA
jgi:hypothetical protein